jgi:ornithine cyclodeaminase/alanine dehydrogenase-like protein (mu-crystallin family)
MSAPIAIFDEPQIRGVVTPSLAVASMRDAFRADGERRTNVPAVINLIVRGPGGEPAGEFHVKTAYISGVGYIAVKIASGFAANVDRGLPAGSGMMAVFDAATGLPAALLLDNGFLTDIRTGAAGAVAAEVLARESIDVVGVLGSGLQARWQIACLREVRSFSRIVAWSRSRERLEAYCAETAARWDLEVSAAPDVEMVCRSADLLVTATAAREPLVRAAWLRPGMHVTALGSDSPGKQELEAACLARADLIAVDRVEQCAAFGELAHAESGRRCGVITLGEIVAGRRAGRTDDTQITIADLTGVGFQDTAIASSFLTRALEKR